MRGRLYLHSLVVELLFVNSWSCAWQGNSSNPLWQWTKICAESVSNDQCKCIFQYRPDEGGLK